MIKPNLMKSIARQKLYDAARGHCFYCGIPIPPDRGVGPDGRDWLLPTRAWRMVVEHKIPIETRGGPDVSTNTVASCARCNSAKGSSTVEEFRFRLGLVSSVLPYIFYGEAAPPVTRDYLVCVSPELRRGMILHNFPGSFG